MSAKVDGRRSGAYVYSLAAEGFQRVNGRKFFNRPLYGTHDRDADSMDDSVLVVAGDRPRVMSILLHAQQGAKGGILSLGVMVGEKGKWLHEFDRRVATYDPGRMRYRLEDEILEGGSIRLEVVPLMDAEGFMVRIGMEAIRGSTALVWTYGGLAAFGPRGSHMDYAVLEQGAFDLEDYAGNVLETEGSTFRLSAPETNPGQVFQGACSIKGSYHVADARMLLKEPGDLIASQHNNHPVLAYVAAVEEVPFEGYIVVLREAGGALDAADYLTHPDQTFDQCVNHYQGVARRVVIETPDRYLNKGMEALCLAMDACWHHPTFMHGAWSWHEPYLGWRGWYGGDALGWHDRVRTAIRAHAATQIQTPEFVQPTWSGRHGYASGGDSRGGLPSMLSGEITHVFYNMVEVYLDHIFYHYQWTGDLDLMREIFPVIRDALDWEQRTFDPDDDGLYENWLNTWVSDAHWYNGGGCIQSSAYNGRANRMAAEIAERLGMDPEPFRRQAEKIKRAVDQILWLSEKGIYAEYKDAVGLERVHKSPEQASIYHPIDFGLTDDFQAYQMLRFTEYGLKNEYKTPRGGRLIWSSAWEPPLYSSQGLYPQEILNTLLCYYRIGQTEEAQRLLNGCVASWYMGPVPGGIAHNIQPNGEHFGSTDFTDTVSMFSRCVVEGLFGVLPQMQDQTVTLMPGFPRRWTQAKIRTPDVAYEYERKGLRETVRVTTPRPTKKILNMIAKWDGIRHVRVNGQTVEFKIVPGIGCAYVVVETPSSRTAEVVLQYRRTTSAKVLFPPIAAYGEGYALDLEQGEILEVRDPQGVLHGPQITPLRVEGRVRASLGYHTFFVLVKNEDVTRWHPVDVEVREAFEVVETALEVSDSEMVYSFRIRNNRARSLMTDFVACFADERVRGHVDLEAYATSEQFVYPVHHLNGLSPGQHPLTVTLGEPRSTAAAMGIAWDLWEKRPDIRKALASRWVPIPLEDYYNDALEEIHHHEFCQPRPSTYSIMTKIDGRPMWDGNLWGYGKPPIIDDSTLRGTIHPDGCYMTKMGIPFRQVVRGKNVAVVSIWDRFPTSMVIPVQKKGRKLYLLIAGSTHPMQSQIANGRIVVRYEDETEQRMDLVNPDNFDDLITAPYHHEGATETIGNNTHALVLDMILDRNKVVRELEVWALSNEVLIGLLGVTLL